jgi:hypothetical protein
MNFAHVIINVRNFATWQGVVLTYIPGFSVKFFFQPIYTDYANWAYFDKRSHSNLLL